MHTTVRTATTTALAAGIALVGALSPAAAQAAEPYACGEDVICIYEGTDGTGDSREVEFMWAGGYVLEPSGWANRASSIANHTNWTLQLLSDTGSCYFLRDTIQPGEERAVSAEAAQNFDEILNDPGAFPLCPED